MSICFIFRRKLSCVRRNDQAPAYREDQACPYELEAAPASAHIYDLMN